MSFVKIWSQFYSLLHMKRTVRTFVLSKGIFDGFILLLKEEIFFFSIKAIYLMVCSGHSGNWSTSWVNFQKGPLQSFTYRRGVEILH